MGCNFITPLVFLVIIFHFLVQHAASSFRHVNVNGLDLDINILFVPDFSVWGISFIINSITLEKDLKFLERIWHQKQFSNPKFFTRHLLFREKFLAFKKYTYIFCQVIYETIPQQPIRVEYMNNELIFQTVLCHLVLVYKSPFEFFYFLGTKNNFKHSK